MVNLVKGQRVPNTEFEVITGGDYNETDIVPVKKIGDYISYCAYQANYITTGEFFAN